MVQFNAHYDGNVIKPDEPIDLQVGPVRVTIDSASRAEPSPSDNALERLKALAKKYAVEGPEDMAENHDFYAHGKPRQ